MIDMSREWSRRWLLAAVWTTVFIGKDKWRIGGWGGRGDPHLYPCVAMDWVSSILAWCISIFLCLHTHLSLVMMKAL